MGDNFLSKNTSMISRLAYFIKKEEISVRKFEEKIGASNGMIRKAITNNTDIQSKWITSAADNFPHLNIVWLLTGEGKMYKDDKNRESIELKESNVIPDIPYDLEVAFDNITTAIATLTCVKYSQTNKIDFDFNSFALLSKKAKSFLGMIEMLQSMFETEMSFYATSSAISNSKLNEDGSLFIPSDSFSVIEKYLPKYIELSKLLNKGLSILDEKKD